MANALPGGMTPERFYALPLREQFIWTARARVEKGLPPYSFGESEVRESAAQALDEGAVRESASASDMPNILGNNLYRELDRWFLEYDGTWRKYCNQTELVDYRPKVVAFVSEMEDAREVRQERDIQDSGLMDKGYSVQLKNWARQITLPFVVIENDDKGFVKQIPEKMSNACDRTIQKLVVRNTLEANLTAYDGVALFSNARGWGTVYNDPSSGAATTSNLISGAGSTLTRVNIQAGIAALQQTPGDPDLNPSGVPLNIPAKYLLVPTGLEFAAAQILNSAFLIGAATVVNNTGTGTPDFVTQGAANPLQMGGFQTPLTLLVERYLTNQSAWYLLPDAKYGPIVVATRQGRGLRPRMWCNVPQRQAIMGGGAEDWLLSISDIVYGFSFDLFGEPLGSCSGDATDKDREFGEPCGQALALVA